MKICASLAALIAVAVLPIAGAAADVERPLTVFAAYVTPLEEPWNTVIHQALLAAQQKGQIRYTWKDRLTKADEFGRALRDRAANDAPDILVADGFEHRQIVEKVAADFPKIAFVVGSNQSPRPPNLSVFDNLLEEPAYLCGLIAGKMTKTNVLGVVAGHDEPTTNRNVNAFVAGAKEANPRVKVKVVFIDSWYDPDKAGAAALAQIKDGADLFYAERAGVVETAKEKKVLAFGNLLDRHKQGPDTVITGPVWDMNPAVQRVIAQVRAGKYKAEDLRPLATLANGGARLADWHGWDKKLPADVLRLVQEKEAAIKKGEFKVKAETGRPKGE